MIGENVSILMPDQDAAAHDTRIESYISSDIARFIGVTREVSGKRRNGSIIPIEIVVSELRVGGTRRFIAAVRDITARKNFEDRLRYLATRDTLTGLPNRNLFVERLEAATHRCDTAGTRIAVCYVDLDQF